MTNVSIHIEKLPRGVGYADNLAPMRTLSSGIAELDAILPNGGFPRGKLTELQGSMMSGKLTLAERMLGAVLEANHRAAFIDLPGTFFPLHLPWSERLLVARPTDWKQALRSADVLVQSREWELVVVDLTGQAGSISGAACNRLARGAKEGHAVVLLMHDHGLRTLGSLVALRLRLRRKLLPQGRAVEAWVVKNKLASPGDHALLFLHETEAAS